MAVAAEETFAPPGPGVWLLETTHWTRPVTRFHAELFPEAFGRDFGESLRRYGSLLEYLEFAFVNAFPITAHARSAPPRTRSVIRRRRFGRRWPGATRRCGSGCGRAR